MHELNCPSCNTASQYNFQDYLLLCPFCSATFKLDIDSGQKEIVSDHYIVPNTIDSGTVKELTIEWLKRLHHKPSLVEKEFFVVDIQGFSVPAWIVSMEAHTTWGGLIQKKTHTLNQGSEYLAENGQFRRSYRWAILARKNFCETWGLNRLHQPQEDVHVEWDGFPLDSTFSRGRLVDQDENEKSAYDIRKFFEFKYANGLPILAVQVSDQQALRRARFHVQLYHYKLCCNYVDFLVDNRTELEIAGLQLIHLPFWRVSYIYTPKTILRYFIKPRERNLILDGYGKGVLNGELAIIHGDKVMVNAIVCGVSAVLFLLLGMTWHQAFYLVAAFAATVALVSLGLGISAKNKKEQEELLQKSNAFSKLPSNQASSALA